jgi:hypothetical protein
MGEAGQTDEERRKLHYFNILKRPDSDIKTRK